MYSIRFNVAFVMFAKLPMLEKCWHTLKALVIAALQIRKPCGY
jgi:hypothetical protein